MPAPSEWLEIMLGEIERKRADAAQALTEEKARERERVNPSSAPASVPESGPFSAKVSQP
jgi:hypothetical protein